MPSGSKKRKAAKKKKENQANNIPKPSSVSGHAHGGDDDKENGAGEVSSPASQDHHGNKNSFTEEGEYDPNPPSVEGVKTRVNDEGNIVVGDKSVIPVEREFKIEDASDKKDEYYEHDETSSKPYDGGSSGSSSSSSNSDDESHGIESSQAVADTTPVEDSTEVSDSLSGKKTEVIHSATGDSAAAPSTLTESVDKTVTSVDDNADVPEASKDAASQRGEANIQSVENIVVIPDTKECIAQESDDQSAVSTSGAVATADNGSSTEKDSGVTEPLLAPAPHPAQRTTWKSCCGLFEMLMGSGR